MSKALYKKALKELKARQEDIRPSDVVLFSEPLRTALNYVIRLGRFSLTELAQKLEFTREQTGTLAEILIERNLFVKSRLSNTEETYFESRLSALTRPLTRPAPDIWKKID
jgi:hypothetical protein